LYAKTATISISPFNLHSFHLKYVCFHALNTTVYYIAIAIYLDLFDALFIYSSTCLSWHALI